MTTLSSENKRKRGRPVNPKGGINKAREIVEDNDHPLLGGHMNTHQLVDYVSAECGVNKTTARLYIYRIRKQTKATDAAYVATADELYGNPS